MKRLVLVACASLAVLLLPLAAAAQPAHADSPRVTMILAQDTLVGTAVLQPGEYRFQCRTFEGKTFLVVSSVETGKEITRVPCVRETLDAKVPESALRTLLTPDGKRTLTLVKIKGELVAHRIVN
jgi:hypothetical protein